MKHPTKQEIKEEMDLYNADEVGLKNPINMEEAEYNLLNSDKFYYANQAEKLYNKIKKRVDKDTLKLINAYANAQLEIERECN